MRDSKMHDRKMQTAAKLQHQQKVTVPLVTSTAAAKLMLFYLQHEFYYGNGHKHQPNIYNKQKQNSSRILMQQQNCSYRILV